MAAILLIYARQSKSEYLRITSDVRQKAMAVLALLIFPLIGISQKTFSEKFRNQIEKTIAFETTIDYGLTPGFIVGIVDGENSIVLSFGTRALMSEDTISVNDVFELGSVTKVFTASLIAEMDRSLEISINDRFDSILPQQYQNDAMSQYTFKDLLTHNSGLPRYPPFTGDISNPLESLPTYSLDDLLDLYANFNPTPIDRFIYSNVGYAMAEPILYNSTGLRYNELLDAFLLEKNKMTSTGLTADNVTVPGYDLAGELAHPLEFGVFNASGGLKSSMTDMLKFVRYSLFDSPDILWVQHGDGLGKQLGMGLGWHILLHNKFAPAYVHTGRSIGHTAFVGLVPKTKTGVVILSNSASGVDDLGLEILRMINKNWKRKK